MPCVDEKATQGFIRWLARFVIAPRYLSFAFGGGLIGAVVDVGGINESGQPKTSTMLCSLRKI